MKRHLALIVDGYNVIRNNDRYAGLGVDYEGAAAWNKAREAVINDAALFAADEYERCTVVFDGAGNPESRGLPQREAGVDVVFSPSGVSADSVIEKLAHDQREAGFEVIVVSSDFTIQTTVFGGGVTRMSAATFAGAGDELEDVWRIARDKPVKKSTVADRINPETRAKLEAMVRSGLK